jgi:5'-nucleotidase
VDKPLILVTNDDGLEAEGLWAAVKAVLPLGEVVVVAPDRQWSGAGRSMPCDVTGQVVSTRLELDGQIVMAHAVDGSPALAVQHGLLELAPRRPALVVSGVNFGFNLGSEVTISGTVGAALEAGAFDIPALAVSLEMDPAYHLTGDGAADYTAAKAVTHDFAQRLLATALPDDVHALSVNVPRDATPHTPWRVTHLSRCRYFWPTAPDRSHGSARPGYRLLVDSRQCERGSDIYAVDIDRVVSVTPLSLNLTSRVGLATLESHL